MAEIILENVSLYYPIYRSNARSLKRSLVDIATGGRFNHQNKKMVVTALQNVSFNLNKGDRLGLIGHNGAGKSTLLKVLAGVYEPQQGKIKLKGKVSSLLDMHVGMQFEATGYENINLRSLILGLSKKETKYIIPGIEEFTDLGNFISMPVKTYSAGMVMRLAFGISTAIVPDILLLDEAISAGDGNFMTKATKRIEELMEKSNIVVISSHMSDVIRKYCNKILWMEHGMIKQFGELALLDTYLQSFQ